MKAPDLSFLSEARWLSRARIRRILCVFAVLSLAATVGEFWRDTQLGLTSTAGRQLGVDFINYWSGAHLAFRGEANRVYDIPAFVRYERAHTGPTAAFRWYAYPPVALLLSAPLAVMSFLPGFAFWLVTGTALSALLFVRYMRWPTAALVALANPAAFLNAIGGQNGQFTAALLAGGLMTLESRPVFSGILFGMMCYKPQFGILLPFALAAGGRWRTFVSAAVTVVALCGASLCLFGWQTWASFLRNAPINRLLLEQGDSFWHRMTSLFAAFRLAGADVALSYGAQLISTLAALAVTVFVWRSGASVRNKGAVLLIATFLATPYAWDSDMIILTFAVVWLWQDARRAGFAAWEKLVLVGVVGLPIVMGLIAAKTHVQIAPALLWIALVFAARRSLAEPGRTATLLGEPVPTPPLRK